MKKDSKSEPEFSLSTAPQPASGPSKEPSTVPQTESEPQKGPSTPTQPESGPPKGTPKSLRRVVEEVDADDEIADDNEFFVPIHGFIRFTDEEMDVIDHPAFQRLAEIYQLGQSHLVFRGATHKRIEHVLGTVHVTQEMIDAVSENHGRISRKKSYSAGAPLGAPLSKAEQMFTRLAALLHDIGHLPAGHTLEDELEMLPKHDEIKRLDLVLDRTDWPGSTSPTLRTIIDERYSKFLSDESLTPSGVVYQIIAKDRATVPPHPEIRVDVCRDIVGNTICADLLDYLHRDWFHIGKPKYFEKRIFQYMEIRQRSDGKSQFVISLGGRPRLKTDAVSAILDLLESRYQLAEAVLFHRTKCAAAAMLERAIQELSESVPESERNEWIAQLELRLLDHSDVGVTKSLRGEADERKCEPAKLLLDGLKNRRVYKALYTTFYGDRVATVAKRLTQTYSKGKPAAAARLRAMRLIEREFGLPSGSLAIYCPTRGMNAKIARVCIHMDGAMETFEEWEKDNEHTLGGGHLQAQIHRFHRLWRVHVFLNRDLAKTMDIPLLNLLRRAVKEIALGIHDQPLDEVTYDLAVQATRVPGSPFFGQEAVPREKAARRDKAVLYPSGAPLIGAHFVKPK